MPDVYTWLAWAIAGLSLIIGAQVFGIAGLLVILIMAVVALTIAGASAGRRARRHLARHDPRFEPTDEVFNDPAGGGPTRVYVDRATGERRYWTDQ
jgi:hypothetical protein